MNQVIQKDSLYVWEAGDTFALIALKYCRKAKDYLQILDMNKRLLSKNNYRMVPGDVVEIPPSWVPIKTLERSGTIRGTKGYEDVPTA